MNSKNIFLKIKKVFTKNTEEKASPTKTPEPAKKGISFGDKLSDEIRIFRRRGLSKRYQPYTREELIQDCVESDKLFQLFKAIDDASFKPHDDLNGRDFSKYFKDSDNPVSRRFYEELYKKGPVDLSSQEALDITSSSLETLNKGESPLVCIATFGLYDQEEPVLENIYPDLEKESGLSKELTEKIKKSLVTSVTPDTVSAITEDFLYFLVHTDKASVNKGQGAELLYGVSFFKQFPVTAAIKEKYPTISRPNIQKAICVVSKAPIFAGLVNHFEPIVKEYLTDETVVGEQILKELYGQAGNALKIINIDCRELQAGVPLKKLLWFLKEKTTTIWKALFLERKVLVYSEKPSSCSTFIHALLSLLPCACHFKYHSSSLALMENHYHEYGIPLQIFHDKCPLFHHFGMRNVEEIATGKGFLGGTSNFLIKTLSKVGWDILIDLDNNSVQFKNDSIKKAVTTSKKEKELISGIIKKLDKKYPKDVSSWSKLDNTAFVEKNEEIEYEGSEEWIRQKFNDHLKEVLTEIEYFRCYASEAKLESTIQIYNAYLTKKGEETEGKGSIIKLNTKVDSEGDSDRKSFERLDSASPSPFKNIEQRTFFPTDQNKTESPKKMSEDSIGAEGVHKGSLDEFEEKKDSKDNLEVIQEENLNPDDPRVALKKELAPVKSGMKTLKDYGPEWITEWAKTDNFRCWARRPREMIRDRSVNNPSARDYLWLYENGDLYYGGLASGQKQGNGQYIYRNLGWIYRGAWAKDKRSGPATITSIKGTDYSFEGSFKNDKKDGPGKLINGKESYSGTFANDKYEGSGVLTDVYQNLYDGEFKDGYKWGMGKLKYANGETYIGEMLKDTLHGRGTYVYSSGHVYSGLFNSGRKTGQGILQSPTGDVSEGQFIEDEFCGRGTLRKADGHTFEGEFSKGELVNGKQGVIYYPDGSKYEGPIVNYKPHGEGKLTKQFEKIEIIKGRFENGELVEEFKEEAPKNQAREEEKKDENPAAPIETQADKKEIEEVVNEEKEIEKIKKEEEIIEKKEEESEQKSEQKEEAAGEEGEKEEAS